MTVEFKDLIELIKAIAWPIVVAVALLAFRKPIARFVEELGKRAMKLSAFDVSIEFATIPSPPIPWSDPTIYESSNLIAGAVTATTIMELFQRISDDTTWHYLIVDIETGKRWLISRLFIFTVILRYMRNLKCVVFVETKGEYRGRLLGIAKPESVRFALARKYPWFDEVIVKAWSNEKIPILTDPLPKDKAQSIVNAFIQDGRVQQQKDPQNQDEWEQVRRQNQPLWEHTKWLDIQRVNEDLREVFCDRDASQFADSPDIPAEQRNKALLHRQTPFVALVNDKGEFRGLVDRHIFLNQVAARLGEESDKRSSPTNHRGV